MSSRKHTRYKLLLDEGLSRKEKFQSLNNLHNLKHIKHDLKKGGAKDYEIYKIAEKEKRMVLVFNTKDFKPLIQPQKPSVIALSTGLTNEQIDLKLCKILKNLRHNQELGHLISITNEGVNRKEIKIVKNS